MARQPKVRIVVTISVERPIEPPGDRNEPDFDYVELHAARLSRVMACAVAARIETQLTKTMAFARKRGGREVREL